MKFAFSNEHPEEDFLKQEAATQTATGTVRSLPQQLWDIIRLSGQTNKIGIEDRDRRETCLKKKKLNWDILTNGHSKLISRA